MFTDDIVPSSTTAAPTTESSQQSSTKRQQLGLTRHDTDSALNMKCMSNTGLMTKTEGTWAFWSPDMCSGSSFSGYAADMWAAGVCLYIFVTGKLPFYNTAPLDLMDLIKEGQVPYEGLGLSNEFIELLKMTLEKDPAKRAGVGDCLKHPLLLGPRKKRIEQLSVELARSKATNTDVEESDIRAVRICDEQQEGGCLWQGSVTLTLFVFCCCRPFALSQHYQLSYSRQRRNRFKKAFRQRDSVCPLLLLVIRLHFPNDGQMLVSTTVFHPTVVLAVYSYNRRPPYHPNRSMKVVRSLTRIVHRTVLGI